MSDDIDPCVRPSPRWQKKPRPTPAKYKVSWLTSWTIRYVALFVAVLVPFYVSFFRSQSHSSHIYPLLVFSHLVDVEDYNNAAFRALQRSHHPSSTTVVASLDIVTASISRSGQQRDRLASYITGGLTAKFRKAMITRQCTHLNNAYASFSTAENYTHEAQKTRNASLSLYDRTESLVMSASDDTQAMRTRLTKKAFFPVAQAYIGWAGAMVGWSTRTVTEKVKYYGTIEHWSTIYKEVASNLQAGREAVRLEAQRLDRFEAYTRLIKESIVISLEGHDGSDARYTMFDFETCERFFLDAIRRLAGDDVESQRFSKHSHSSL